MSLRQLSRYLPIINSNGGLSRSFHQSSSKQNSKLYELRVYQLKPECTKPFIELSKEWMHLRFLHSVCIGYWTSEIGGINDMVHIWEYDSLEHRAQVRQTLASDSSWIANYFSKILPMMTRQENALLQPKGDLQLTQPEMKGVYELESFRGQSVDRPSDKLMGSFTGLIGPLSTEYNLWYHKTMDDMVNSLKEAKAKSGCEVTGHSRLLLPTPWSPLY